MSIHELDSFDEMAARRMFHDIDRRIDEINGRSIQQATGGIGTRQIMELSGAVSVLRARYIKSALALASEVDAEGVADATVRRLQEARVAYEEALQAFGALRHAIGRGYVTLDD
jgi:hypothetical protein